MTAPRIAMAAIWAVILLVALCYGITGMSGVSWWFGATLLPPLIAFIWWMRDRAGVEQRIRRLEARSEIGDERRVVAREDLTNIEHKLREMETRVARVEASRIPGADAEGILSKRDADASFISAKSQ